MVAQGVRVKTKDDKKSFFGNILEIDALGNIIVQRHSGMQTIQLFHPNEVVITKKFKTTTSRYDEYGSDTEIKCTRTATLRIGGHRREWNEPHFDYREDYSSFEIPLKDGQFTFPRRSWGYTH